MLIHPGFLQYKRNTFRIYRRKRSGLRQYNMKQRLYNRKLYIYNRKCRTRKGVRKGYFCNETPGPVDNIVYYWFFSKKPLHYGQRWAIICTLRVCGLCAECANNNQRHAFAGGCRLCHPGNFRRVPTIRATGQGARPKYFRNETLGRVYSPHTKRRKTTWQIRRFVSS